MTNLSDALITDILPASLGSSVESKALAYSIHMAIEKTIETMNRSMVYAGVDSLPDKILNVLAVEFNVPYWSEDFSVQQKRAIIKNSFAWHAKAGTASAVSGLVSEIFDTVDVEEWFNYSGSPYHFRVNIGVSDGSGTDEQVELAEKLINAYKNVRSVLDSVNFYESGITIPIYGYVAVTGESLLDGGTAYRY